MTTERRLRRHAVDGLDQRLDGVRVVAVVGDQRGAAVVEHVEAAGRGVGVVDEAGQAARGSMSQAMPSAQAGGDGGHGVLDLEADGAVAGERDVGQRDAVLELALGGDDGVALDEDDALALGAVGGQHRVDGGRGRRR